MEFKSAPVPIEHSYLRNLLAHPRRRGPTFHRWYQGNSCRHSNQTNGETGGIGTPFFSFIKRNESINKWKLNCRPQFTEWPRVFQTVPWWARWPRSFWILFTTWKEVRRSNRTALITEYASFNLTRVILFSQICLHNCVACSFWSFQRCLFSINGGTCLSVFFTSVAINTTGNIEWHVHRYQLAIICFKSQCLIFYHGLTVRRSWQTGFCFPSRIIIFLNWFCGFPISFAVSSVRALRKNRRENRTFSKSAGWLPTQYS